MELRQALPKIVTETVPGPKSKALIDRRADGCKMCLPGSD